MFFHGSPDYRAAFQHLKEEGLGGMRPLRPILPVAHAHLTNSSAFQGGTKGSGDNHGKSAIVFQYIPIIYGIVYLPIIDDNIWYFR